VGRRGPVVERAPFFGHWDGTAFRTIQITDDEPRFLEHGVFTPLSLATEP